MSAQPKFELVDDGEYVPVKRKKKKRHNEAYRQRHGRKNVEKGQMVRDWMWRYKAEHPCACGESDPACLDFHHVEEKNRSMSKVRTMTALLSELPFCVVMCANCHRKIHGREAPRSGPQMGLPL